MKTLSKKHYGIVARATVLLGLALLFGCASDGSDPYQTGSGSTARIKACRVGDTAVASASRCLQDDAACYQIANGGWCTGERGNQCPTGSTEISAGASCPRGTRCFDVGESKRCAISFK